MQNETRKAKQSFRIEFDFIMKKPTMFSLFHFFSVQQIYFHIIKKLRQHKKDAPKVKCKVFFALRFTTYS